MSFILNAVTSCPDFFVNQHDFIKVLTNNWPHQKKIIDSISIDLENQGKFLSLPLNYYSDLIDSGKRNIIWKAEAIKLQSENINKIQVQTPIDLDTIGLIVSATSSGISSPTLDGLMMNKFSFSNNTLRVPLFGLGDLAGLVGINRINDYLEANPEKAALLMVTELSSLHFHFRDDSEKSINNAIVYGDAAGAVLMLGNKHPLSGTSLVEIIATGSAFIKESEDASALCMLENGFVMNSKNEILDIVKKHLDKNLNSFLEKFKISTKDITFYILQPNGPKVLEAICETLNIGKDKIVISRKSMEARGNTSGASFIHVLEETLKTADLAPNSLGLMMSMGPGFCFEFSLIKKH